MELLRSVIGRYIHPGEQEWSIILGHWQERTFPRGALVSHAGAVEGMFYVVKEGVQRLFFEHDGGEHCLGFSYGHSWSGDYESFISQRPGRVNVQAVTDSVLIGIRYQDLQALYREYPVMERFGRLLLEEVIQGRLTREIEMITLTAEERYRQLLNRSPHLLQLVAQKDIASYLHMTPETLSRIRAKIVS